ncbi:ABC transporter substrate-binding protein [Streptosporangium roseum]|uniref:Periplasmic binding protein n=1 Tax=Streptosporangium roseum (strain ATCC 12428 / DSM 43021 / JCM 3005 / KCTC 9067 / NCIMB 10171 / NRRL 2505 / NI 9100) TaxID=479432 RepID=D2B8N8_STRRD|nr:ABC transporter substrate-binding protein [Streptosporangium roseum]ACZ87848.1 periplasmic binding protein [Streptosporangium roseum DSM 43021]
MTGRRSLPFLSLLIPALLVAGCGTTGQPTAGPTAVTSPAATGFPLTVTNCGVTTTFQKPPQRAVTLNQHVTEIMLALGLEKSMAGTAFLDDEIPPAYESAYRGIKVLAEEYPSYEALLSAEPDFVYGGFTSAFDDKEGRSRAVLAKAGINSHVNIEACPTGPVTMTQVEDEIRTIGKIFGVSDRAEQQITTARAVLDGVKAKIDGAEPARVFVYDSGDKTAFTAGGAGIGNEMIKLAGGTNLFADLPKSFGDVSFEQVADRAPEVIVIYDYGDKPVEGKKKFLLANPALKDVPAIKNQRFAVLPLSSTVLGVRVPAGVEALARQIHPDRFA